MNDIQKKLSLLRKCRKISRTNASKAVNYYEKHATNYDKSIGNIGSTDTHGIASANHWIKTYQKNINYNHNHPNAIKNDSSISPKEKQAEINENQKDIKLVKTLKQAQSKSKKPLYLKADYNVEMDHNPKLKLMSRKDIENEFKNSISNVERVPHQLKKMDLDFKKQRQIHKGHHNLYAHHNRNINKQHITRNKPNHKRLLQQFKNRGIDNIPL